MKKYIFTILAIFFLGINFASAKDYSISVPIPEDTGNWPPPFDLYWGGDTSASLQFIGQEFRTASDQNTIDGIEVYMKVENGCPSSPTYDLALSLFEGHSDEVDILKATAEMSLSDCQEILNTGYVWHDFLFPETVSISPSTYHHFRLYSGDHTDGERFANGHYYGYRGSAGYYYYSTNEGFVESAYDIAFRTYSGRPSWTFEITDPLTGTTKIKDTTVQVSGTCITEGSNRIALTNDCSNFSNLNYTIDCVDHAWTSEIYYNGSSDWIVAVDIDSVATDCVNYDLLMDIVDIDGIEVIEGYPDDWYFNYDYYEDFDIIINSPIFVDALTLPLGSTDTDISFKFIYPTPLSPGVTFNVKQYDENGNLLNASYHNETLVNMADTNNYVLNFLASSSPLHYVVQLYNGLELSRQFPFGIYVSDLDLTINPDDYAYLFPRLVEKLKQKIIFNYFFTFYDGFYNMFRSTTTPESEEALDITFNSVSADGEYDLEIPIFKGSDPTVKQFSDGLRPFIISLLWVGFAVYVFVRVTNKFKDE